MELKGVLGVSGVDGNGVRVLRWERDGVAGWARELAGVRGIAVEDWGNRGNEWECARIEYGLWGGIMVGGGKKSYGWSVYIEKKRINIFKFAKNKKSLFTSKKNIGDMKASLQEEPDFHILDSFDKYRPAMVESIGWTGSCWWD